MFHILISSDMRVITYVNVCVVKILGFYGYPYVQKPVKFSSPSVAWHSDYSGPILYYSVWPVPRLLCGFICWRKIVHEWISVLSIWDVVKCFMVCISASDLSFSASALFIPPSYSLHL